MPQAPRGRRRPHEVRRAPAGRAPRPGARVQAWWVVAAALIAAGGLVWWGTAASRPQAAAQQIGERLPDEGYNHVPVGTRIVYRAHPPASGPHYPSPAPAGVYPQGLPPGYWVHSLEHGYVVLVYKPPVSPGLVSEFEAMVREFPKSKFGNVKLVIAPYDDMPRRFAVLSWDWRLWMDVFDRAKVLEFYRAHVDRGREDIP